MKATFVWMTNLVSFNRALQGVAGSYNIFSISIEWP